MPFLDDEQSKHAGRPVELFKYQGTYDDYFYTSGPAEVTYLGDLYIPIATKRSALNVQTQNDDNSEVTIELPVSSQLIAVYGFQIAPPDLKLTIYRGHNGDFIRAWSGNVENIQVVKGTASVRVPSDLAAALNTDLPNVYYQGPCNHALFDERCGVSYAAWSFATEVAAIDALTVTLDGIGTLDGQLVGGDAVLASGERRMIIAQAGNVITVNYPFAQIAINDVITIAAGCDLAWAGDCATRFNNQERFGGFPFIPPKNIFSTGLEPGKDISDIPCLPPTAEYPGWDYELQWVVSQVGGNPTVGVYQINYPGVGGVYEGASATNPAGPVVAKGSRYDASSNTRVYFLKMKRSFPAGDYTVTFDPPNLPGFQSYRFRKLDWFETVAEDLIVPFGTSSSGTQNRNFTVT
jgi:Phage conserved hypothetical protein BR0599